MTAILATDRLTKRFGGLLAIADVSLEVRAGEIHALIGPNGAGKSTLVGQLSGSLRPDAGIIRFDGVDITRSSPHLRVRHGLARSFQIPALFTRWTVVENVAAAVLAVSGTPFRLFRSTAAEREIAASAAAVLQRVGLAERRQALVGNLSHGEKRLLEIALAIASKPRVLLLDEPLAGVGPTESAALLRLIAELRQETAILLVEHDMQAVFALADRISVLVSGQIIASGPPDEIRANAAVQTAYLGEDAA